MQTLLVTGGAGFIGSIFVDRAINAGYRVIVLDKFTYAGKHENLESAFATGKVNLIVGDICDLKLLKQIFKKEKPNAVVHFAAESHVDRSIENPTNFIQTNIIGTYLLLNTALEYQNSNFRFIQVSTDEVYGELGPSGKFNEDSPELPNSPYSASKAAGDLLAHAWFHTYGLSVITTHCSNNYGPRQDSEKLIPHLIQCGLSGKKLPIYGNGSHIRDWIHVEDHCDGILLALEKGQPGRSYCFGGNTEKSSLEIAKQICKILNLSEQQITFVPDRRGHDRRYAIDDSRAQRELGFTHKHEFEQSLRETVSWYVNQKNFEP